ncbi:hypothetical protein HIM_08231 [Hirsutella minnesotensis 3608]|uniref:Uncharacterized protein n=1 Tax=Hirsutella minnesotensis 3608 TaxID=1043627 RepID=A0A0F7ZT36_9HYPO|nr:hypothetical protein HIM_08231 [Hirsutella minnesotensis 3608]
MPADGTMASIVARGTCPVQGNSDLYGLGIRLGLYIQMITVQLSGMLSVYFRVDDHIGQGTIIFVLSTSIVLVRLINASIGLASQTDPNGLQGAPDPPIEAVEVFPVMTLLMIQLGVCRVSRRNMTAMLIWMIELVGLTALFNYYWWRGMDLLPRSCPDDKAFFFAKVSIWGWFRSFNKASAVLAAIGAFVAVVSYCGTMIYVCVLAVYTLFRRGRFDGFPWPSEEEEEAERSQAVGTFDLLANVGAIVYVEVSLKWNGITGVHSLDSPGQFMPFFIALGQLLSVFYCAAKYFLQLRVESQDFGSENESMVECHHVHKAHSTRGHVEDVELH